MEKIFVDNLPRIQVLLSEGLDVDDDNVAEDMQDQQANHVKTRTRR